MPPKKSKRTDGRYQTTLTIGYNEEGKPIKKYFYGETQKEAAAKKKAYQSSMPSKDSTPEGTLGCWIDKWVEASSSSETVRKSNKRYGDKLKNALGHRRIEDIRMMDIKLFAQSMSGYSYSTVKQTKAATALSAKRYSRRRKLFPLSKSPVSWFSLPR